MLTNFIRTTFLTLIALLLSSEYSYACDCMYRGEFIEYSKGHTVIKGRVDSYGPKLSHGETLHETMTVSIVDLVHGNFSHPTIEFVGDPGNLCLTYVDSVTYALGSEHLFTVFEKGRKQGLGGCGEVSVSIIGDTIKGRKLNDAGSQWVGYSVEYNEFIETLKDPEPVTEIKELPNPKPWWKFW